MKNFFKHLHTVNTHKRAVFKLCKKCGITWQGIIHDLSKYSPTEFLPSIKYWTGKRSPIEIEIDETGCSEAWLHHKGRNKHHYQYWLDLDHENASNRMPIRYVAEMFCDRVAASKTYLKDKYTDDSPLDYLISHPYGNDQMHPDTYMLLEYLLTKLKYYGEDITCKDIAEILKKKLNYEDLKIRIGKDKCDEERNDR